MPTISLVRKIVNTRISRGAFDLKVPTNFISTGQHLFVHSWTTTRAKSSPGAMTNSFRSNRTRMHFGGAHVRRR